MKIHELEPSKFAFETQAFEPEPRLGPITIPHYQDLISREEMSQ